jgi:hypothetical protein
VGLVEEDVTIDFRIDAAAALFAATICLAFSSCSGCGELFF